MYGKSWSMIKPKLGEMKLGSAFFSRWVIFLGYECVETPSTGLVLNQNPVLRDNIETLKCKTHNDL